MQDLTNYKKEKLTINLIWANIFGLLILIPIILIFGTPYYLIWNPTFDIKEIFESLGPKGIGISFVMVYVILLLGVVIHELIHGITWARYTKNGFKSLKFGVLWKMLTPYCHCKEPLNVKQYIAGAIAPAIILGLIPSVIGIIIGNLGFLIFGMFFTMAAAGDILIINLIRKEKKDDLVQDHPSEAGCYIYRKIQDKLNTE